MKIIVPALALALATGCSPSNLSVRILGANPLDDTCTSASEDVTLIRGFLNVALTSSYFVQFGTKSNLDPSTITDVEDVPLNSPDRNDFVGEKINLRYTSSPATTFPTVEPSPIYFVIPAGDQGSIRMNLIPGRIGQDLVAKVPAGNDLTLFVTFSVEGHLFGGQGMKTNEVTFPIDVVNVPPPASCPSGSPPTTVDGPCGNVGQDSLGFTCG